MSTGTSRLILSNYFQIFTYLSLFNLIFFRVLASGLTAGTYGSFSGIILTYTEVVLQTGSSFTGKSLQSFFLADRRRKFSILFS